MSTYSLFGTFARIVRKVLKVILLVAIVGYTITPFALIYAPHSIDFFVFLNHVALPFTRNFSDLSHFGLCHSHVTPHYVETADGVTLGTWLIEPPKGVKHRKQVILYHHGNSGTRGTPHRITLYELLASAGYDVVAFDYRGYADSNCENGNCEPTEQGLITDAKTIYHWTVAGIKKRWNGDEKSVIIWGHSLGGGAATNLAKTLCHDSSSDCDKAKALILEATFNDISEAATSYPLAWPLYLIPSAIETVGDSLQKRNLAFNNTAGLMNLRMPVLMLHALDDVIVPAKLSQKAHSIASNVRPDHWPPLEYKLYPIYGYGHRGLHDAPDLVETVSNFVDTNS